MKDTITRGMEPSAYQGNEGTAEARRINMINEMVNLMAFVLSAIFSVLFFVDLAGGAFYKCLYGALAVVLEAMKMRVWRQPKTSIFLWMLGVGLLVMSLLASTGSALVTVERAGRGDRMAGLDETLFLEEIRDIDERRQVLLGRMAALPPTWVTKATELGDDIAELDLKKEAVKKRLRQNADVERSTNLHMFSLLSALLGMSQERLVLGFLLAISLLLELSILARPSGRNRVKAMAISASGDPVNNGVTRRRREKKEDPAQGLFTFAQNVH